MCDDNEALGKQEKKGPILATQKPLLSLLFMIEPVQNSEYTISTVKLKLPAFMQTLLVFWAIPFRYANTVQDAFA